MFKVELTIIMLPTSCVGSVSMVRTYVKRRAQNIIKIAGEPLDTGKSRGKITLRVLRRGPP